MTLKRVWKSWPAIAAIFLLLAAPALSQQVRADPNVTVYESPT